MKVQKEYFAVGAAKGKERILKFTGNIRIRLGMGEIGIKFEELGEKG